MNPPQLITRRSLDQLETDLISLSSHINAMEYEFLVLLREFDLRQGWKAYLFNHCSEWLNMKCGMAPGAASEKLRVANALFDLPLTSEAFQKGELSYSKARSLTRILTPHNEEHHLDFAIKATASQVDRHCQELRNVQHSLRKDIESIEAGLRFANIGLVPLIVFLVAIGLALLRYRGRHAAAALKQA